MMTLYRSDLPTREARIAAREADDITRSRLWAAHVLEPSPDSPLMQFIQEEIEMAEAAKRGRKPKTNSQAEKLVAALDFVSIASKDTGQGAYQNHVRMGGNMVIASDGVLMAGAPIVEDLMCCPHLEQLKTALAKSGKELSITITDNGNLSLKGDKLRATVQSLPFDAMPDAFPDDPLYPMHTVVKAALGTAAKLTREGGTRVVESSVLLCTNSCYGSDGQTLVEYWHGVNLPDMVIPRAAAVAVSKVEAELTHFGYGDGRSVTFWFADRTWIKTQLYAEGYPMQVKEILNFSVAPVDVPGDFFTALDAVEKFAENGLVTLAFEAITTHGTDDAGATYDVKGLNVSHSPRFNAKRLIAIAEWCKTYDPSADEGRKLCFFGDSVRGCVMSAAG